MKEGKNKSSQLKFYAIYSSLGIQMVVIIVALAFGGRELDKWLQWHFPVFTIVLTLLGIALATLYGIRELFKQQKK